MSTQHTPGPPCRWCEQPTTITDERTIDGQDIIRFVCQPCRQLRDVAPDLLAALREATEALAHVSWSNVPYDPSNEQCKRAYQRGLSAIAKAEEGS